MDCSSGGGEGRQAESIQRIDGVGRAYKGVAGVWEDLPGSDWYLTRSVGRFGRIGGLSPLTPGERGYF